MHKHSNYSTCVRMTRIPQPTDRPGIFRCPECGLQNPRPIAKPFRHQCGNKPVEPPPPLRDQVGTFLRAMHLLAGDGFRIADADERERRITTCVACELFIRGRCLECGCFGKLKALGKVWTCPEGKW